MEEIKVRPKEYKSKYRSWILQYFADHADVRIGAREIYEAMRAAGFLVNQATVYRNLDRLEQEHVIQGHRMPEEDERFYQYLKPALECDEHLHLVCSNCGKIIHLNCGFMKEIRHHLEDEHGFALNCRESVLVGLCAECQKTLGNRTAS